MITLPLPHCFVGNRSSASLKTLLSLNLDSITDGRKWSILNRKLLKSKNKLLIRDSKRHAGLESILHARIIVERFCNVGPKRKLLFWLQLGKWRIWKLFLGWLTLFCVCRCSPCTGRCILELHSQSATGFSLALNATSYQISPKTTPTLETPAPPVYQQSQQKLAESLCLTSFLNHLHLI